MLAPWVLQHKGKNLPYNPLYTCIWGNPPPRTTYPSRRGFNDQKMWKFKKMSTPNRLGMDSECKSFAEMLKLFSACRDIHFISVCIRFSPKKKWEEGKNPLYTYSENNPASRIPVSLGSKQKSHILLEKILTGNRQKRGSFAFGFQQFSRGDTYPPPPPLPRLLREDTPPLGSVQLI